MPSTTKRRFLVTLVAVVALAAVACDEGHRFTIINETDGDVVYVWDGVPEGKLLAGTEQRPGLLFKYGDGGLPERHLFQAFDVDGNLICESHQRGRRWETTVVSLGALRPGQDFESQVVISSVGGEPFTVLSAEVIESPLTGVTAEVVSQGNNAYQITIRGNTGSRRGVVQGKVQVRTDVPGEDLLTLSFTGNIR